MTEPSDTQEPRKGLLAYIYSPAGDNCSANGISARYSKVVVVGIRPQSPREAQDLHDAAERGEKLLPKLFTADQDEAEVELVLRFLGTGIYIHAVPTEQPATRWSMFGGCYIDTSDSRWTELLRGIYADHRWQVGPIPLHDRYES